MDGNGRWAQQRGLERIAGHQAGRKSVREVVEGCVEIGIPILTLYTFSIENWQRPVTEVQGLMAFLRQVLEEERGELRKNGVRLRTIGRVEDLPEEVRRSLRGTQEYLAQGDRMCLNLALSYGGRAEIVDTLNRIAREVQAGRIQPGEIDEELVERFLYTSGQPHPDLLIRTSGELRLSNFLLWQLAYAEIWVTETLWPDFRKEDLFRAVADYQKRNRRFGRVG
ncbi:MAG: di-trans,poly-cis-decaprenylcistransferase [Candidatus Eisenbacteria bacterium]|nr:di-trans,poly-cis-decaprenylcistransferase [Candidatus Eisenbacteria bacterium]